MVPESPLRATGCAGSVIAPLVLAVPIAALDASISAASGTPGATDASTERDSVRRSEDLQSSHARATGGRDRRARPAPPPAAGGRRDGPRDHRRARQLDADVAG